MCQIQYISVKIDSRNSTNNNISCRVHWFFPGSSSVLQTILYKRWWAPNNSSQDEILLDDISKKGVEAMLAFIYYQDMTEMIDCSRIAMEVLFTANKYLILPLEKKIIDLMLVQTSSWYQYMDALLYLYLFLNCTQICNDLEVKIATIIKRFQKNH